MESRALSSGNERMDAKFLPSGERKDHKRKLADTNLGAGSGAVYGSSSSLPADVRVQVDVLKSCVSASEDDRVAARRAAHALADTNLGAGSGAVDGSSSSLPADVRVQVDVLKSCVSASEADCVAARRAAHALAEFAKQGRSSSRPAPRPVHAAAPPPKPVQHAPPPAPVQSSGGSMLGGLGATIAHGLAFGTGSAIAHRAVDGLMGPRTVTHEHVTSDAPAGSPNLTTVSGGDACTNQTKSFQDCINAHGSDIGKCQFYVDMLNECRRGSAPSGTL